MWELNLSQLVGGEPLTKKCTISNNGIGIKTYSLLDCGANGNRFLDVRVARAARIHLRQEWQRLKNPIPVKGFDGKPATPITEYIALTLNIDGRNFRKVPFLITTLGSHDIILGRIWFAENDVLIDCKRRNLVWPEETPAGKTWNRVISTSMKNLEPKPNAIYQADADRRDRLVEKDPWRPQKILCRSSTWTADQEKKYQRMEELLRGEGNSKSERDTGTRRAKPEPRSRDEKLSSIDICGISGEAFQLNLKREENQFFTTSFYEIDRLIEERTDEEVPTNADDNPRDGETELQWLKRLLPQIYSDDAETFSKEASNELPPHRKIDHKITLENPNGATELGYSPLYHQSTKELREVKRYLTDNLSKGFIEASQAPFASPILFVKKKDGSLRFCIDFRKLNKLTRKDRYPIPLIDETLARLAEAKIYTKLDIRQAFHRIRMDPESEELTTFRTRFGAYKCKVLPFGLTNGPATYQRYMNEVLFDYLDDFCTAYLDDILIYSQNEEEHIEHVKKVLARLRSAGLQVDIKKSEFHVTETKYLGFVITTEGIATDPEKIDVVQSWKAPETEKGVRSFLGFCNFYRRFIHNYSRIARPLVELTRKDQPFVWTEKYQSAYEELKTAMLTTPILQYYHEDYETMVETDASNGVVEAVISQQNPGSKL